MMYSTGEISPDAMRKPAGNKGRHTEGQRTVSSLVGICKEIYLITVGLTEANVATVLAGWLSK